MDQRGAPEFILEAFADPNSIRDVVRGILNLIFFLRFFPTVTPRTRDVLGLELSYVAEAEIETLIEQRVTTLVRQLEADRSQPHHPHSNLGSGNSGSGRGQVTVQFFDKKRPKSWFRGNEEVCWESWVIKVTVADPKTEGERAKVRKATVTTLHNTVFKIITFVNSHKDHIPPITTQDSNPFPYEISINQHKSAEGWAARMGIY